MTHQFVCKFSKRNLFPEDIVVKWFRSHASKLHLASIWSEFHQIRPNISKTDISTYFRIKSSTNYEFMLLAVVIKEGPHWIIGAI